MPVHGLPGSPRTRAVRQFRLGGPRAGQPLLQLRPTPRHMHRGNGSRTTTSFHVVDPTRTGLHRVGLIRPQVVDTDAAAYPATQALARHLYSARPTACGIQWTSKRLDRSRAIMLFADRVLPGSITLVAPSRSVLDSDVEERILDLVEALGMRFLG